MSGHQISNSAGPNDDKSQYVLFATESRLGEFHSDDHYDDAMTMLLFEFSEPGNTYAFTRHISN